MHEVWLILVDDSACVASIVRTYYSWRMFESYDTSWELGPVGLWSFAELSIGIMVGCLPSLPRFFQHVGPKIYRCIGVIGSERKSSAVSHSPMLNALDRAKRPFAKYGFRSTISGPSDDSTIPRAQVHDKYFILDDIDASSTRVLRQSGGTATARDFSEYGQ